MLIPRAPHSCIGDKASERISLHSERRSILIRDFKRDYKFGYTLMRLKGMIELILLTPGSTLDIPIILDVVDVEIAALNKTRRP